MSSDEKIGCIVGAIIYLALSIMLSCCLEDGGGFFLGAFLTGILLYFINKFATQYANNKKKYKEDLNNLYEKKTRELSDEYAKKREIVDKREKECKRKEEWMQYILKEENTIITLSAQMYSDIKEWLFVDAEKYLRYKPRPSAKGADVVKEMRENVRYYMIEYRKMQYKKEILCKTFPELIQYFEDDSNESIESIGTYNDVNNLHESYDRRANFLSKEEWQRLSESERSQLALNRYNQKPKSNWTIGIEYEMYIEYWFREKKKCKTIPHGSLNGLEDLGRDIIAEEDKNGTHITYIIQCKRYSANKQIHENTICQLYGTAIEYELSHSELFGIIIPILYTTTDLSPMATKFAERLGVKTYKVPMREYPQIKCNIGRDGEKIYHLPFDQQYYNVKIDKPGEFYAWTVKEAEDAGFRRAKKYIF